MKNNANKEKTNEEEEENFAERLTIFFLISANKDEIAMKSTAEVKENEGIKKKKKQTRKLQHNCFVLFVPMKKKKRSSHKSTRMSNISCERQEKKTA
jgi:hypothetical protein